MGEVIWAKLYGPIYAADVDVPEEKDLEKMFEKEFALCSTRQRMSSVKMLFRRAIAETFAFAT